MKLLSRYTRRAVILSFLLVLVVIIAIDAISALVDGLGDIKNSFTFMELLFYILLTMPERIYENIPISTMIGCIVGLGILANNSELTIMRATGVSLLRIFGFVISPVAVIIIIGVAIGEYVVPFSEQLAESRKTLLRTDEVQTLDSGLWNKEGNEFMHFNAVYPDGRIFGVSRYSFDSQRRLQQASYSERVIFMDDHWLEENGRVTTFLEGRTVVSSFETRKWDSDLTPELLQYIVLPPESLGIQSLFRYSEYLDQQGRDSSRYRLSFWSKVLQPLTIASLVLVAISFVFGPLRDSTMGFRIFIGVLVGVVVNTVQDILEPASLVYHFPPVLAVLFPAALMTIIGLMLLRRVG